MRTDPFRELDQLSHNYLEPDGTLARPSVMPTDAWRHGDAFIVEFDLPGIAVDSIDLDVERNVVMVKAEHPPRDETSETLAAVRVLVVGSGAERHRGLFSRQFVLVTTSAPRTSRPTKTPACCGCGSGSPSRPNHATSASAAQLSRGVDGRMNAVALLPTCRPSGHRK